MNLKSLLSPQYLFSFNSANINPGEKLVFIGGMILVLLAIVLKISAKLSPSPVDSKYRGKFYRLFLTIGLSMVVWYGLRYENTMFFSDHFVPLLLGLWGIIWFIVLTAKMIRGYKTDRQIWEKEQVRLKYLPK